MSGSIFVGDVLVSINGTTIDDKFDDGMASANLTL